VSAYLGLQVAAVQHQKPDGNECEVGAKSLMLTDVSGIKYMSYAAARESA